MYLGSIFGYVHIHLHLSYLITSLILYFPDHCYQGLGAAADGHLEDSAFSASSSYDEASVGPKYARYEYLIS